MTLKESIQKDEQIHLSVKSVITSGTTQYYDVPTKSQSKVWVFEDEEVPVQV